MINQDQLFQQIPTDQPSLLQEFKRPILKHLFTLHQQEVSLILTQNHIVIFQNGILQGPTHCLPLTFDVKFQTIYEAIPNNENSPGIPVAIKLERQTCSEHLTFYSSHPAVAERWSLELEQKINQRNFHSLFKAKKKIGKGAFATVYLAQRLRDNKMVAVKAFSKQKQYSSDKGRQSLENEIKLMRKLNHSNISRLEGVYETQNSIYVILEYLQGKQLNEVIKSKQKMQSNDIKQIIQNILKGLTHLNNHRIIHRDLKPENIIFRRDKSNDLAICDFGLATHADEQKYLFVRCGTPGFVAPEIINIKDMSSKSQPISDIFSAGIIFHYLLFGCSVFQGKKYNQILQQNRVCNLNFDREIYHNKFGSKAFDLLTKMLQKDQSKRITAENALNHQYFLPDMDVEFENKVLFKNSSLMSNYPFKITKQADNSTISGYSTARKKDSLNYSQGTPDNQLLKYL